jgi:DNA-binding CsgD family transcriptional regulator
MQPTPSLSELMDEDFHWTPRQKQVLELLTAGKTNAEIAAELEVGLEGAKWHIREITSKLGVSSREDAAEYWRLRSGLRRRFRHFLGGLMFLPALKVSAAAVTAVALSAGAGLTLVLVRTGGETAAFGAGTEGSMTVATPEQTPAPNIDRRYFAVELMGVDSTAGPQFDPAGAPDRVIVQASAAAPFALRLSCDAGEVAVLELVGPVADRDSSVAFEYPPGSRACHWLVEASGNWSITAK